MARLSRRKLESILTEGLGLTEPRFMLESVDGRLLGNVISPTFKGKRDHKRQEMICDALEEALGPNWFRQVGMLLAYTPDEWRLGEEDLPAPRKSKRVG